MKASKRSAEWTSTDGQSDHIERAQGVLMPANKKRQHRTPMIDDVCIAERERHCEREIERGRPE